MRNRVTRWGIIGCVGLLVTVSILLWYAGQPVVQENWRVNQSNSERVVSERGSRGTTEQEADAQSEGTLWFGDSLEEPTETPGWEQALSEKVEQEGSPDDGTVAESSITPQDTSEQEEFQEKVAQLMQSITQVKDHYRQILMRRKVISQSQGRWQQIYPGLTSQQERDEYIQAQVQVQQLLAEYRHLTGDISAFDHGGWVNEMFAGMLRTWLEGDGAAYFFSDDMIRE